MGVLLWRFGKRDLQFHRRKTKNTHAFTPSPKNGSEKKLRLQTVGGNMFCISSYQKVGGRKNVRSHVTPWKITMLNKKRRRFGK